MVGPATDRLRAAGGLRAGITVDDVAMFVRMAEVADSAEQRAKALDFLLAGMSPGSADGADFLDLERGLPAAVRP